MVLNKIGLTGATGMLGQHLKKALENEEVEVIAVSRKNDMDNQIIGWNLNDWKSTSELDEIFKNVQAVIHAGAQLPGRQSASSEFSMYDANIRSSFNLGSWAIERKIPFVYISGAIVYKDQTKTDLGECEELGWNKLGGFYGFSKILAEDTLIRLRTNGLKLAVIRPSSIYGQGLPENKMVSQFLNMAKLGKSISLKQPVNDRIDFIHACEVSNAVLQILKLDAWDTYNISSGELLSIMELAEACISATGRGTIDVSKDKPPQNLPVKRFSLNTERARSDLGWKSSLTIEQGLKMMINRELIYKFNNNR